MARTRCRYPTRRKTGDAADSRPAVERTSGHDGPPPPGYPLARLCAEATEAGIQARSVRTVSGIALCDQTRCDPTVVACPDRTARERRGNRTAAARRASQANAL